MFFHAVMFMAFDHNRNKICNITTHCQCKSRRFSTKHLYPSKICITKYKFTTIYIIILRISDNAQIYIQRERDRATTIYTERESEKDGNVYRLGDFRCDFVVLSAIFMSLWTAKPAEISLSAFWDFFLGGGDGEERGVFAAADGGGDGGFRRGGAVVGISRCSCSRRRRQPRRSESH